ncbi:HAD-like domain-containing protein [Desarmillaria tabescens]|uniref:HAD-like domain-containing protein n=1 Tax=Armillaria tabescens TaxID=1929756 RepID=A0AA39N8W5_ARMTA|nr:HAD-like domain-containing protein [Desarmillaria tabescens]KAK0461183.1 HAD-like domain-containing protein [Desarmillaria tabescens]
MSIRLVTFDALFTLINLREPVHVQYTRAFKPYLGELNPDADTALAALQKERPAYDKGSNSWWSEVIRRTALGAKADSAALDKSLQDIVHALMHRFSSREGYKAYDDAIPLVEELHSRGIRTAVISNSDSRTRSVLKDLGFPNYLDPIILSEEEGIEKPSKEIFIRALDAVNRKTNPPIKLKECLHVGDELECDYYGGRDAGMESLLVRGEELNQVLAWIDRRK